MRYMMVITWDEKANPNPTDAQKQEMFTAYIKYTEELRKAGVYLDGDGLLPTSAGARVSVRNGKRSMVDGPFSEAKEVVGGYYLVQVKSKEEAVEWASRCPGAHYGTVEVRQLMEHQG